MPRGIAEVKKELCIACGECIYVCPRDALSLENGLFVEVDKAKCIGCRLCESLCPTASIVVTGLKLWTMENRKWYNHT